MSEQYERWLAENPNTLEAKLARAREQREAEAAKPQLAEARLIKNLLEQYDNLPDSVRAQLENIDVETEVVSGQSDETGNRVEHKITFVRTIPGSSDQQRLMKELDEANKRLVEAAAAGDRIGAAKATQQIKSLSQSLAYQQRMDEANEVQRQAERQANLEQMAEDADAIYEDLTLSDKNARLAKLLRKRAG